MKHFSEDDFDETIELPYKSLRYSKKVAMRNKTTDLTLDEFMNLDEYREQDIWDLKYISTSDEEDNDSDIASEKNESDEEEEEESEGSDSDSEKKTPT